MPFKRAVGARHLSKFVNRVFTRQMLNQLQIILSQPTYPANIGAVARACANFGAENLILVSPKCDIDVSDARKFATFHGKKILLNARVENSLVSVLSASRAVVGFTARVGTARVPTIAVGQIGNFLKGGVATSLLFGNEENGLDSHDISLCTHVCQIPTVREHGAINLSHAVAIVLSRVFEDVSGLSPEKRFVLELASQSELQVLAKKVKGHFQIEDELSARIERMIKKANFTSSEVRLIYFLLGKANAFKVSENTSLSR